MRPRAHRVRAVAVLVVVALSIPLGARPSGRAALPERLSDAEFWKLVGDISEPGGYFRITDNFTSNENEVGQISTMLRERGVTGGAYLGVGPEQNFSYIAALHPAMAFICDIRRQAVVQHLMFKAMFELADDRADFISLLFAKPRPAGLERNAPIQQIWMAFAQVTTDAALTKATADRVTSHLIETHKFALNEEERGQLSALLEAFVSYGPDITTRGGFAGGRNSASFADLTGWSMDRTGQPQSFLSTDENFRVVKTLEERNLLVPVSGDFGGPHALRAIGAYLGDHGGTVNAFYVSNVEQYLFQDGKDAAFYGNVATLPTDDKTVFIRPYSMRQYDGQALCTIRPFLAAATAGRVATYNGSLACAK
jgi:hypothetical protein